MRFELALDGNSDRLRRPEPYLACCPDRRDLRGTDARGERPERAVGNGMRVRADYQVARPRVAFLRKKLAVLSGGGSN